MPEFNLPYGAGHLKLNLPDEWHVELLTPEPAPPLPDPLAAVEFALDHPVGARHLSDFAGIQSAAIAINDKTRPVPHSVLLPPLLSRLEGLGVQPEAITLCIATGSHPPMSPAEYGRVIPAEILRRYPVLSHNANDPDMLIYLGKTGRGTPVWINQNYAQADLRIVVGNIEPHQFMGFSGGVKSAAIGLAGVETINHNHALMTDRRARLGRFDDNPARQDVEEIGRLAGIHFALNAILNEAKQIVAVVAGEPGAVMQKGIPLARRLYQVEVSAPFDLMIVSPGGHPKDINLYQAQKALAHAALVTRDGGAIVVAAACPEGAGSQSYQQWMEGMTSYQMVFERFEREGFRIGPHKAYQIARDAAHVQVLFLSQMPPDLVEKLLLTPVSSLEEAITSGLRHLASRGSVAGEDLRVGVMPWANATIPVLQSESSNELPCKSV
ncbi:MAG: nickel-dependent lactate racemase [Anaerolineae bacterium]